MGVPAEYLGKQVRCPHCRQVVLAPLTASPSGAVPAVNVPPAPLTSAIPPPPVAPRPQPATEPEYSPFVPSPRREGTDSIIGDPNESEDEVFPPSQVNRRRATVPPLDLSNPSAPAPAGRPKPDSPFEEIAGTTAAVPGAGRSGTTQGTSELRNPFLDVPSDLEPVTMPPGFTTPPSGPRPVAPTPFEGPPRPVLPIPVPVSTAATDPFANLEDSISQADPARSATAELDEPPTRPRRRPRDRKAAQPEGAGTRTKSKPVPALAPPRPGGSKSNLVLYAVIGYAVLATLIALYGLFGRYGSQFTEEHPMSTFPDPYGEFDPADRKKVSQLKFGEKYNPSTELPPKLRAQLKGTITVGQLEVRPLKIERRPLTVVTESPGGKVSETTPKGDALVLTLAIKNTSSDLTFHPMDPAFTRKAKAGDGPDGKPFTRIVVAKDKDFAGGFIEWPFAPGVQRRYEQEQEKDWTPLGPNQERTYVVFTDTQASVVNTVSTAPGDLQWRVQVRRGPIEVGGKSLPATAIIGVDFRKTDIRSVAKPPP